MSSWTSTNGDSVEESIPPSLPWLQRSNSLSSLFLPSYFFKREETKNPFLLPRSPRQRNFLKRFSPRSPIRPPVSLRPAPRPPLLCHQRRACQGHRWPPHCRMQWPGLRPRPSGLLVTGRQTPLPPPGRGFSAWSPGPSARLVFRRGSRPAVRARPFLSP